MKNEEKAKEIAESYYMPDTGFDREDLYDAEMEMAKWKDEQHSKEKKQLIDAAGGWLKENIHDYYLTNEFEQWFDDMFEDLKKEMEGGMK